MSCVKHAMYNALENKFEADRAKAIATLQLSFESPVAVGEHPTLLDDMAKLITDLATAEESLAALRDNFGEKMVQKHDWTDPSETPEAPWVKEDQQMDWWLGLLGVVAIGLWVWIVIKGDGVITIWQYMDVGTIEWWKWKKKKKK